MKDWTTISLAEYYKIKDLIAEPDEYTTFNLLDTICGIDSANLPLAELGKYAGALEFLNTDVPEVKLHKTYTINNRTYDSNFDLTVVTVGQFVDYQNYIKEGKYEDILSVFFIPTGHKYNDGYDIRQVKDDLLSLDFATVHTIAFFFSKQLELFLATFQYSLSEMILKMNLTKEEKAKTLQELNQTDFSNLVYSRTSFATLKKQILHWRKHLMSPAISSFM